MLRDLFEIGLGILFLVPFTLVSILACTFLIKLIKDVWKGKVKL